MSARVILYTRKGCHLCDEAKSVLDRASWRVDFALTVVDIDTDPDLRQQYNDEVPVITINGAKAFKYHVDLEEFLERLARRT